MVSVYLVLSRRSRRSNQPVTGLHLGFPLWELEDIASRLAGVEREVAAERLAAVSAQLGGAQPRLAAIRPLRAAGRGWGSPALVRVLLMFEGSLELSGVVDAREVAQFMPLVRSGLVPRVAGVMMSETGMDLLFSVDSADRSTALQLRLADPRIGQ